MKNKILLTGANRGLGLELCRQFLERDYDVVALNRATSPEFAALQAEYDSQCSELRGDICSETQVQASAEQCIDAGHHFDIILNNAAAHLDQDMPDITDLDFDVYLPSFQVNSVAPLILVKHFLPLLNPDGERKIAFISSEAGSISQAWRTSEYAYCMSKAALNMACKILQNRIREQGIKVLALHPGWFSSDMGGTDAPITPADAAMKVVATICKDYELDDGIYFDNEGVELPW